MKSFQDISSFASLSIEAFWYPARKKTSRTVLLLKGIYGLHVPSSPDSWDTELIKEGDSNYNFICINTARRGNTDDERKIKEAFDGKTFDQECDDIRRGLELIRKNNLLSSANKFMVVGNSFGGTLLLNIPEIIKDAKAIIMVGSGCGKSSTTTKPLLQTMPEESILLQEIRSYEGVFSFIRGTEDNIVPKMSQDKIIENAINVKEKLVCEIKGASHDLTSTESKYSVNRTQIIISLLNYCMKD